MSGMRSGYLALHIADKRTGYAACNSYSPFVHLAQGIVAEVDALDFREYEGSCESCVIASSSNNGTVEVAAEKASLDSHKVLSAMSDARDSLLTARAFWAYEQPGRKDMDEAFKRTLLAAEAALRGTVEQSPNVQNYARGAA